jgi:DNA-binding response OmpR family regulator
MHALIIEDSYLIAAAIEHALRELGFTSFDLVARASQAILAAKARCPDLITAEASLADGSGVGAVLEICREKPIPVVFVVGENLDVAGILPLARIVAKTSLDGELSKAVREVMRLHRLSA